MSTTEQRIFSKGTIYYLKMNLPNVIDDVAICPELEYNLPPLLAQYLLDENEVAQIDWNLQCVNQKLLEIENSHSLPNNCDWTNFTTDQIGQKCYELFTSIDEVMKSIELVQNEVYKQLSNWQRNQRMARSGDKDNAAKQLINKRSDLEGIQAWFGELYAVISKLRTLNYSLQNTLLSLSQTDWSNAFQNNYTKATAMLQHVISSSFVVEEQPPQIIKTGTK